MNLRQHLINVACATVSLVAATVAARAAAERIDSVGSRTWINVGAVSFTLWVFIAIWLVCSICAIGRFWARYALGDMRRRPGHAKRDPSWTQAQWDAPEWPQSPNPHMRERERQTPTERHVALVADAWVHEEPVPPPADMLTRVVPVDWTEWRRAA